MGPSCPVPLNQATKSTMGIVRKESAPARLHIVAALLAMVLWLAPSPDALALKTLVTAPLTVIDVQNVIARAVTQAVHNNQAVTVAISDREGNALGVFIMTGALPNAANPDLINQLQPGGTLASA